MDDIRPPKRLAPASQRPLSRDGMRPVTPDTVPSPPETKPAEPMTLPVLDQIEQSPSPVRPSKKRWIIGGLLGFIGLIILGFIVVFMWYQSQLSAVSSDKDAAHVRLEIQSGSTPSQIASLLKERELIRSDVAFRVYTKLTGTENSLQAGAYSLSPNESTPGIVEHLTSGKVDEFSITFLPGATLQQNRQGLIESGYSEDEVDQALEKTYNHPLLVDKPATSNLEGYIYGETYNFATNATVEDILTRTFDEYYKVVQSQNLVAGFASQNLNLHQGIIMASIIQREVPGPEDQKQVAQVFLKRYREGIMLGSDITAYYGADLLGERRTVAVDSPYNTRIYTGMPPGPIASPGATALAAVANPASGDYLFFLSGDDEVTYFARTDAEHQANIVNHCAVKCAME